MLKHPYRSCDLENGVLLYDVGPYERTKIAFCTACDFQSRYQHTGVCPKCGVELLCRMVVRRWVYLEPRVWWKFWHQRRGRWQEKDT